MQLISITKDNAVAAFNNADDKGKTLLSNLLGKDTFEKQIKSYQDIFSFEDACKVTGDDPKSKYDSSCNCKRSYTPDEKWEIIVKAYNPTDWKASYVDSNQKKWYPWFRYDGALGRFVFNHSYYDNSHADAGTGVRRTFSCKEHSDDAGKKFESLINEIIN